MNLILPRTGVNGLPVSEDSVTLHLFILTKYQRVMDGQIGRIAVAKTALSIAGHCKNDRCFA